MQQAPTLPLASIFSPLDLTKVTVTSSFDESNDDVRNDLKVPADDDNDGLEAESFAPLPAVAKVLNAGHLMTNGLSKTRLKWDILIFD